jgi:copper chaperone CopZ
MAIRLKVQGMRCEHCAGAVRSALEAVPGVKAVEEVSVERGETVVRGDADLAALVAAIEAEGYQAQPA